MVPTIARHPDPPDAEAIANQAEVKVCKAITFVFRRHELVLNRNPLVSHLLQNVM